MISDETLQEEVSQTVKESEKNFRISLKVFTPGESHYLGCCYYCLSEVFSQHGIGSYLEIL